VQFQKALSQTQRGYGEKRVKTIQPTKMELIRGYLKKFHAEDEGWSTNEVIE